MTVRRFLIGLIGAALVLAGAAACVRPGEMHEVKKSIPLEGVESADVSLRMNSGELRLGGGASGLVDAHFRTNVERWKPEVRYDLKGGRGRVDIEQPRRGELSLGRAENTWDVRLNDGLPLDLEARFGAGEARLELGSLNIRDMILKMGVGDMTLDLVGYSGKGFRGRIKGGIGHASFYLPRNAGVRVAVHGGLGSIDAVGFNVDGRVYTNDAYERSETRIDLDFDAGIGSLDLRLK